MNRRFLMALIFLLFAGFKSFGDAQVQKYKAPQWNGCIQQFYDRDDYGWLSFRNSCSETLTVVYIARKPGHGGYAMDLRAGRKDSTGWSRSEVEKKNGFELYVCPLGYQPVDADDRYVNRIDTRFRCKEE